MFIEINKRKLKKTGISALAVILALGGIAGYKALKTEHGFPVFPGQSEKELKVSSSQITNWGLSFQKDGEPPIGNATVEELSKYDAFYCLPMAEKEIFLTFDAGYENGYTKKILDVLKEEKVPAAFFLVGTYIEDNPDIVNEMVAEGHTVGNHTMHHPDMSSISDKESFKKELADVEKVFKDVTGKNMKKFYRPPQGKFSVSNLQQAKEMGYKTIFWSLAYVDWYVDKQPTKEEAFEKLVPRTHNGAIILLHSTSKTNAKVLKELIQKWKSEGYKFKSVTELKSPS